MKFPWRGHVSRGFVVGVATLCRIYICQNDGSHRNKSDTALSRESGSIEKTNAELLQCVINWQNRYDKLEVTGEWYKRQDRGVTPLLNRVAT